MGHGAGCSVHGSWFMVHGARFSVRGSRFGVGVRCGTYLAIGRRTAMQFQVLVLLGVALFVLAGVGAVWLVVQWRWTDGPGEAVAVDEAPRPSVAVRAARPWRLQALQHDEAVRLAFAWKLLQARFIDDPRGALGEADRLLGEMLDAHGLPLGEIEAVADEVRGHFPSVAEHYGRARGVASRLGRGHVPLLEVREAFVSFAVMFEDLLEPRPWAGSGVHGWR